MLRLLPWKQIPRCFSTYRTVSEDELNDLQWQVNKIKRNLQNLNDAIETNKSYNPKSLSITFSGGLGIKWIIIFGVAWYFVGRKIKNVRADLSEKINESKTETKADQEKLEKEIKDLINDKYLSLDIKLSKLEDILKSNNLN